MMKLKVTLFGVLTAISLGIIAPYASAAEPITIFGINWSMTKSEIFDAVRKAGYTCDDGQLGAIDCIDMPKKKPGTQPGFKNLSNFFSPSGQVETSLTSCPNNFLPI